MSSGREKLIITRTGQARGLVGPMVDKVTKQLGQRTTRRASHVEPTEELSQAAICWLRPRHFPDMQITVRHSGKSTSYIAEHAKFWRDVRTQLQSRFPDAWWADMAPSCPGGLVLGPFTTNTEALAAERAWLLDHDIPTVGN